MSDSNITTQQPSQRVSPVNTLPEALAHHIREEEHKGTDAAPEAAPEAGVMVAHIKKWVTQEILESGFFNAKFTITDARTITAQYDPAKATLNLNALVQDHCARVTGLDDIPPGMFIWDYKPPRPNSPSSDRGFWHLRAPVSLKQVIIDNMPPAVTHDACPWGYVNDDTGNAYKITYEEYLSLATGDRMPKGLPYCNIVPAPDSKASIGTLRHKAQEHLSKFGVEMYPHEYAFKLNVDNKEGDGEKGTGTYAYTIAFNYNNIPKDDGLWYFPQHEFRHFKIEGEAPARVTFRKDVLMRELGMCSICFQNAMHKCKGHDDKKQQSQRESAEARREAVKRRRMEKVTKAASRSHNF